MFSVFNKKCVGTDQVKVSAFNHSRNSFSMFAKLLLVTLIGVFASVYVSAQPSCNGVADLWIANDESVSITDAELDHSLDFLYALSDTFLYENDIGLTAGITGWSSSQADIVIPASVAPGLPGTSGIRGLYTTRQSMGGGSDVVAAINALFNQINGNADTDSDGITDNGRRVDVPQVALIIIGSAISGVNQTDFSAAVNQLTTAGLATTGSATNVLLLLVGQATADYNANTAGIQFLIDNLNTNLLINTEERVANYADLPLAANLHISDISTLICNETFASLQIQNMSDTYTSTTMTIPLTFLFGEDVTDFDISDITIGGAPDATLANFMPAVGTNAEYTVDVVPVGNQADIQIDISKEVSTRSNRAASKIIQFDTDGDGLGDTTEGRDRINGMNSDNTDTDTAPDYNNLDSDSDTIPDAVESGGGSVPIDSDGDGIPDFRDPDSDNDTIDDLDEYFSPDPGLLDDRDKDGIPNYLDLDSDADRIPDRVEAGIDTGSIDDAAIPPVDTDGDGIDDYLDTDSDNDRVPDVLESGIAFAFTLALDDNIGDVGGNGIPDNIDANNTALSVTTDNNSNGVVDDFESDPDSDGLLSYIDLDSDGDAILDFLEADNVPIPVLPGDNDNDGIDNMLDSNETAGDNNQNGITDSVEPRNTDGDSNFDFLDIDSDNDGIADADEYVVTPLVLSGDANMDGVDDIVDLANILDLADQDNDNVPDVRDLDSDNDSIFDVVEGGLSDTNGDALIDEQNLEATSTVLANFRNVQSDGSTFDISTNIIAGIDLLALDANDDGMIDLSEGDDDNDGIADPLDFQNGHGAIRDTDKDMVIDIIDLDDDNDGIPDTKECDEIVDGFCLQVVDTDSDGIPDHLDPDSDNDGLSDLLERRNTIGVENDLNDADNDGVAENITDDDDVSPDETGFLDGLHDFIPTTFQPVDTDGDGTPDFRDLDSDNDTLPDLFESAADINDYLSRDNNGDGISDTINPSRGVITTVPGLFAGVNTNPGTGMGEDDIIDRAGIDSDGDGVPDFRDPDSDNDGFLDIEEANGLNAEGLLGLRQQQLAGSDTIEAASGAGSSGVLSLFVLLLTLTIKYLSSIKESLRLKKYLVLCLSALLCLNFFPGKTFAATDCGYDRDQDAQFRDCWFVGFDFGISEVSPEGNSNGWSVSDDSDTAYSLYIGRHFSPRWFADFKYADLGDAKFGHVVPAINSAFPGVDISYQAYSLNLGYLWLSQNNPFNVYTKLGPAFLVADLTDASNSISFDDSNGVKVAISAGIQYRLEESPWIFKLNYDGYSSDTSFFSLSISRYLGRRIKNRVTILDPGADAKINASKAESISTATTLPEDNSFKNAESLNSTVEPIEECVGFEDILERIQFDKYSNVLTGPAKTLLRSFVPRFKANANAVVQVSGHASYDEEDGDNMADSRAKIIVKYLIRLGVKPEQLVVKANGARSPIINVLSDEAYAINRRAEFATLEMGACESENNKVE